MSISIELEKKDSRCRGWFKIVRSGTQLPLPANVRGADDIPAGYAREGYDELFCGDFMFQGEEMHHRKNRGWVYWITWVDADGALHYTKPSMTLKKALKANGLPPALLAGSGDVAALIRIAHGVRLGISLAEPEAA